MQNCMYRVVELPPDAAPVAETLPRTDYADAFRVTGAGAATAGEWAAAVLEEAPPHVRATLISSWRSIGLRPAARDQEAILEWAVRVAGPERVVLARASRVGMPGELVLDATADGVRFSTLVHHAHPGARLAWAAIVPSHVRMVKRLLADGAGRIVERVGRPGG